MPFCLFWDVEVGKVINANGTFCKQFHLTLPTTRRRFGCATHETVLGILSIIGIACYLLIAISFNKLLVDGAGLSKSDAS